MKLWQERPMPAGERKALTVVVVVVWVIALAMNVGHVADHLRQLRFAVALAVTPDFLLLIGVWKLRYRPKSPVAWLALVFGLAWLVWSALSTTEPDASHRIVALAPIGVAIVATLLLELGDGRAAPEPSPAPEAARPARVRAPRRPAPVVEPTAQLEPPAVEVEEPVPVKPARPERPSRERAREILLALDGVDAVSNGHLSRTYGGSDVWWGQRKGDLRAELDSFGALEPS